MIAFSQAQGFYEVGFDTPDGDIDADWFTTIGFKYVGIPDLGENDGLSLTAHKKFEGAEHEWSYLVDLASPDACHFILVKNEADLIALKVKLAPLILADVIPYLNQFQVIMERAFRAWHGHPYHQACAECDPTTYQRMENRAQERREQAEEELRQRRNRTVWDRVRR